VSDQSAEINLDQQASDTKPDQLALDFKFDKQAPDLASDIKLDKLPNDLQGRSDVELARDGRLADGRPDGADTSGSASDGCCRVGYGHGDLSGTIILVLVGIVVLFVSRRRRQRSPRAARGQVRQ